MARLADLITRASKGRLVFNRFSEGIFVADALYGELEPKLLSRGTEVEALFIEDEPLIPALPGHALDTKRYACVAPPFESFWVEAKSAVVPGGWMGVLCKAYRAGDDDQSADSQRRDFNRMLKKATSAGQNKYGWALTLYPIVAQEQGGGRLKVIYSHSLQVLLIDADGQLLSDMPLLHAADEMHALFHRALGDRPSSGHVLLDSSVLVMEVLALLNCVNVTSETVNPPPALSKSHEKKYGFPMSSYKVLTVKGQNLSETASTYQGGTHTPPRQHMVRGHFKRKFGKMYWWAPHLRGKAEHGSIAKTYQVKPPDEKPAP